MTHDIHAGRSRAKRLISSGLVATPLVAMMAVAPVQTARAAPNAVAAAASAPFGSLYSWHGQPAMISNQGVYRSNEYIYQGYIYSDHGANTSGIDHTDAPFGGGVPGPGSPEPRLGSSGGQKRFAGDFMYGSPDGKHMDNVADLIEWRVSQDASNVYYLFQFGDLQPSQQSVVGMCINEDGHSYTGLSNWPFAAGLNESLGCDQFLTVHNTGAYLTDAAGASKDVTTVGGATSVDYTNDRIELKVPKSVSNPNGAQWQYFVAAGLWDSTANTWLQVTPNHWGVLGSPVPTGGAVGVPQIWKLLSNNNEPNTYWREERQAHDLASQHILDDFTNVNFARLAQPQNDPDPHVTGIVDRIYISQFPMPNPKGIDMTAPGNPTYNFTYNGRYQPYATFIPTTYWTQLAANPNYKFQLSFCLHPLNGNQHVAIYYQEVEAVAGYTPGITGTTGGGYLGFNQFTTRTDRENVVYACVNGRGEGVGYTGGNGMVDALEALADVQKHYAIDPNHVLLHGISLGAIGTWYMSRLYPDLFSSIVPSIFSEGFGQADPQLINLHNLPAFMVDGTGDEFGQTAALELTSNEMEQYGNEYVYVHHLARAHELGLEWETLPLTEPFIYPKVRVTNPARVEYSLVPSMFSPKIPFAGSVYWVSNLATRDGNTGTLDITSLARADELPTAQTIFSGLYTNTIQNYQAQIRGLVRTDIAGFRAAWRPADFQAGWVENNMTLTQTTLPRPAVANGFQLTAANLKTLALDTGRMKVDTTKEIDGTINGDGNLTLSVIGTFGPTTTATLDGAPTTVQVLGDRITLPLTMAAGTHALRIFPGTTKLATTTTLTQSAADSTSVTYTATVAPRPDGGTVSFADNGVVLANCRAQALTNGTATCAVTYTGEALHTIVATYSGDSLYAASKSKPLTHDTKPVAPASTPRASAGAATGFRSS